MNRIPSDTKLDTHDYLVCYFLICVDPHPPHIAPLFPKKAFILTHRDLSVSMKKSWAASWNKAKGVRHPLCCEYNKDTYGSLWVKIVMFVIVQRDSERVHVCACEMRRTHGTSGRPQTLCCHPLLRRRDWGDIHVPGNYQDYDVGTLMMYEGAVRGESRCFTGPHY